jgi:uncharacterized protein YndB with AHSA1/START domain
MKALLKQYEILAPKAKVFEALTQAELISAWSGEETDTDLIQGEDFSLWGGTIVGVNLEVSPDRIVQQWQQISWNEPSKVVITLKETSKNATLIHVLHNGIPDRVFRKIDEGWDKDYLEPLKQLVEEMYED